MLPGAGDQLDRDDAVPAELEEPIVHSRFVDPQHPDEEFAQLLLHFV
ncbi:hypothetical protein [Kutzneria buriramensis]|nr:hypothetical protein [Kutzneria buriramensis]